MPALPNNCSDHNGQLYGAIKEETAATRLFSACLKNKEVPSCIRLGIIIWLEKTGQNNRILGNCYWGHNWLELVAMHDITMYANLLKELLDIDDIEYINPIEGRHEVVHKATVADLPLAFLKRAQTILLSKTNYHSVLTRVSQLIAQKESKEDLSSKAATATTVAEQAMCTLLK